ncbi:MAG: hypothetical protein ACR2FV_08565 [Ornithinimicrobium sp.]|uniref:hypothetical protein n=1 Tax=Ornithinimicrobium sp. TaxID=1977084 RepID=UPI003D9AFC38
MSYLQLAHNERHPDSGAPTAKVIHSFGRAQDVDREALTRLVSSIGRFLTPEQAITAAATGQVEVLDSHRLGGAWTLDRIWARLGLSAAITKAAAGRRVDPELAERVLFALVAQRALEPASKLAATRWVAERVAIQGLPGFSDDQAYRAMDFLLEALPQIAGQVFASVAHLLNLQVDILFFDSPANPPPEGAVAVLPAMALVPRKRVSARSSSSCRRTLPATASSAWVRLSIRSANPVRVSIWPCRER